MNWKDLKVTCRDLIEVPPRYMLGDTQESHRKLTQNSRYFNRDSNSAPPNMSHMYGAYPLININGLEPNSI
jgi:hypothetical protein